MPGVLSPLAAAIADNEETTDHLFGGPAVTAEQTLPLAPLLTPPPALMRTVTLATLPAVPAAPVDVDDDAWMPAPSLNWRTALERTHPGVTLTLDFDDTVYGTHAAPEAIPKHLNALYRLERYTAAVAAANALLATWQACETDPQHITAAREARAWGMAALHEGFSYMTPACVEIDLCDDLKSPNFHQRGLNSTVTRLREELAVAEAARDSSLEAFTHAKTDMLQATSDFARIDAAAFALLTHARTAFHDVIIVSNGTPLWLRHALDTVPKLRELIELVPGPTAGQPLHESVRQFWDPELKKFRASPGKILMFSSREWRDFATLRYKDAFLRLVNTLCESKVVLAGDGDEEKSLAAEMGLAFFDFTRMPQAQQLVAQLTELRTILENPQRVRAALQVARDLSSSGRLSPVSASDTHSGSGLLSRWSAAGDELSDDENDGLPPFRDYDRPAHDGGDAADDANEPSASTSRGADETSDDDASDADEPSTSSSRSARATGDDDASDADEPSTSSSRSARATGDDDASDADEPSTSTSRASRETSDDDVSDADEGPDRVIGARR